MVGLILKGCYPSPAMPIWHNTMFGRCSEIIDVTINSASNIMVALLGELQDLVDNIGKGEITAGVQWTRSGHLEKEE